MSFPKSPARAALAGLVLVLSLAAGAAQAEQVSGTGSAGTNTEACFAAKDDAQSKIPKPPPAKPGEKQHKVKVKFASCKCDGRPGRTCTVTGTY